MENFKKCIIQKVPKMVPLIRQQGLDRSYLLLALETTEPSTIKKRPKNARKKGGRAVVKSKL